MSTLPSKSYRGSYRIPAFEHAIVSDAMHPGVMSCDPDATLPQLARMMVTHHVHCIAVMGLSRSGSGESLAWGLVSDIDVMEAGIRESGEQTAGSLAREPTIAVEPTMPLREAGELMIDHGASHVLVISPEGQRPVGVLSTLDVAGVLAWGEG